MYNLFVLWTDYARCKKVARARVKHLVELGQLRSYYYNGDFGEMIWFVWVVVDRPGTRPRYSLLATG
jgi:hypothetical protein